MFAPSCVVFRLAHTFLLPQADIPTTIGVGPGARPKDEAMETDKDAHPAAPTPDKKYYIDSTYLYTPREEVELVSPLKDGLSEWGERGMVQS